MKTLAEKISDRIWSRTSNSISNLYTNLLYNSNRAEKGYCFRVRSRNRISRRMFDYLGDVK